MDQVRQCINKLFQTLHPGINLLKNESQLKFVKGKGLQNINTMFGIVSGANKNYSLCDELQLNITSTSQFNLKNNLTLGLKRKPERNCEWAKKTIQVSIF